MSLPLNSDVAFPGGAGEHSGAGTGGAGAGPAMILTSSSCPPCMVTRPYKEALTFVLAKKLAQKQADR